MSVTFLGNDEYRVYVELGPAIREVNEAEHLCGAGHIVLSPTAWELCTQSLYNHELLEDQQHARVGTEWLNSFMSLVCLKIIEEMNKTTFYQFQCSHETTKMVL